MCIPIECGSPFASGEHNMDKRGCQPGQPRTGDGSFVRLPMQGVGLFLGAEGKGVEAQDEINDDRRGGVLVQVVEGMLLLGIACS